MLLQELRPNTRSVCAGLMHGDTTVAAAVREVKAKGVDGVNIDYEGLDGSCGTSDPYWAQHAMTAFAQKMRAALGSSYYLSIDTYAAAASDGYGFFDVAGLSAYADSFFVMAYDLEYSNYSRFPTTCSRFCLGTTSPLTGYFYNDNGGGAPELWSALQSHFVGCTSVSLSASPASPQFTQTSVTLTASAANCTNAQYRFLLMTPDGSWRTVQDYSTANTFKWTSTANAG